MERFEVVDQESEAGRSQIIVGLADVQQEERVGLPRPEDHVVVDRPARVGSYRADLPTSHVRLDLVERE